MAASAQGPAAVVTALPIRTYLAGNRCVEIGGDFGEIDVYLEIASALAAIPRFHGQARDVDGACYTVAPHCCLGADALYQEAQEARRAESPTGRPKDRARHLAFAFLVHDAHEAVTSDPPRNFVQMLSRKFSGVASHRTLIQDAITEVKADVDRALGFALDLSAEDRDLVDAMDRRMAAAEIAFFFPATPLDAELPGLELPVFAEGSIPGFAADYRCWSPARAAAEWMTRFNRWSPSTRGEQEARRADGPTGTKRNA